MFKKLNKFIVNQMDPYKQLDPVESIVHNEHFRPLCLLIKKKKSNRIFHRAPYYQWTGFTLDDVLLPGEDGKSIETLHQESSQFSLTKASVDEFDGGLGISFDPANVELKGGASLSKEFSIKSQKKSISLELLEALRRERKINMDHSFIRQLQRTGIKLYVVTEILEASEEAVYKESTKADGGFMAKFYASLSAKGTRETNQDIVIPKGCTLAFRTIPLHIEDGEWDLDYLKGGGLSNPGDIALETHAYVDDELPVNSLFRSDRFGLLLDAAASSDTEEIKFEMEETAINRGIRYTEEKIEIHFESEFELEEVETHCQIFSKLSPDLLLIILNTIKAVMRDKNLFQELSQKMEEVPEKNDGYELKTESPDLKDLFSTLQHSPRDRLLLLAEGITYVLDALQELMEVQLLLLLESLERKIVSQQLNLVENLLTHDLEYQMQHFHVDPGLLSFQHKEEQILTIALVELSGVQLHEDGSAVPRDQPFEAMAALFVALYALKLLSGSK